MNLIACSTKSTYLTLAAVLSACAGEPRPVLWPDDPVDYPLGEVANLTDAELREAVEFLALVQPSRERGKLERCLVEIQRRDRDDWVPFLERVLEQTKSVEPLFRVDIDILTLLRRLCGKPDPMTVRIDNDGAIEAVFPEMPVLRVRLQSVDPRSFTVMNGGDYRSGRLNRWRLQVHDRNGNAVPVTRDYGGGFGGGSYNRVVLNPGATWGGHIPLGQVEVKDAQARSIQLPAPWYVDFPGPGTYSVVVQYHDERTIAHEVSDPSGSSILFRSMPATVIWKARVLRLSAGRRMQIQAWIDELYRQPHTIRFDRVRCSAMVFAGSPRSAAEAIYRCGYDALPVLLEELRNVSVSDLHRRARLFAMLAGLTGFGASGRCARVYGAWTELEVTKAGREVAFLPGRSGDDGGPTVRAQQPLNRTWARYQRMVKSAR